MTLLTETDPVSVTTTEAAASDRRRPGRVSDVSPELIPILRGEEPPAVLEFEDVDQTAALRGLFFGVLFSIPVWVAIAYVGTFFLS